MKIYCFAGPNGSGKSTTMENFTKYSFMTSLPFINADVIEKSFFKHIKDDNERNLAAANYADVMRERKLQEGADFAFETVLSDTTSSRIF